MAAESDDISVPAAPSRPAPLARSTLRRLLVGTVASCFRYRVTGLAAEAAFFALISLPPLVLGLVATMGFVTDRLGSDTLERIEGFVTEFAATILSPETVSEVVTPVIREVLGGGRADILSLSFIIALWSGSRALNVYVDTITIAYGLGGHRGIVHTRALSFSLYLVGLLIGTVALPLVVAGPSLLRNAFPDLSAVIGVLYWPVVVVLSLAFLTSLYHLSVPVRTSWRLAMPGAVLAFVIWVSGSFLLRAYLSATVTVTGGPSIYGPLAAPVAVLFWCYVTAIAVLIGAALNAEIDKLWPSPATARARGLLAAGVDPDEAAKAAAGTADQVGGEGENQETGRRDVA